MYPSSDIIVFTKYTNIKSRFNFLCVYYIMSSGELLQTRNKKLCDNTIANIMLLNEAITLHLNGIIGIIGETDGVTSLLQQITTPPSNLVGAIDIRKDKGQRTNEMKTARVIAEKKANDNKDILDDIEKSVGYKNLVIDNQLDVSDYIGTVKSYYDLLMISESILAVNCKPPATAEGGSKKNRKPKRNTRRSKRQAR